MSTPVLAASIIDNGVSHVSYEEGKGPRSILYNLEASATQECEKEVASATLSMIVKIGMETEPRSSSARCTQVVGVTDLIWIRENMLAYLSGRHRAFDLHWISVRRVSIV